MKPRQQFNPFPGLRPFRMDEKHLFFGREEQTDELLLRLRDHRLLAVVGTSGSGKSSLVRAGLLPELHGGSMLEAGFQWEVVVMRPGGDPFTQLAEALVANDLYDPARESVVPETRATLSRSGYGLLEAIRQSDIEPGSSLLLVVDQFEELFRFRGSSAAHLEEAGDFVELLLRAVEQTDVPIYVALTMRSDYLGNCAEFPGLAEAVNEGEYLIPRLTREQRRSVIEGPVRVGGGAISPRLLQALLNEVGDDPDHLPVLQHALMRTWEHWEHDHADDEPIDLRHYESVGGMAEALSRHADEVYDELPDDRHRAVAEKIFKSLTERSGSNPGIRRPGTLRKLGEVAQADDATLVTAIDAFRKLGRTFLMPVEGVELQPDTVIDISHESLMRVWKRLASWVEEESQSARIYGRLRETAALHATGRAGLYHDPDLQIAESWKESAEPNQAWAEQYGGGFEEASTFLSASREAARQVEREKEAARLREVEQAKKLADTQARAARHFRRFAFGMAGVAVVALMAFGIALNARRQAISARQEALHQEHLAKIQEYSANLRAATAFLNDEEGKQAALLALDASAPSSSDEDDLRGWEWSHLQLHADQTAGGIEGLKPLHFAEYSPNGRYLVTAETGIIYKVWEAKDLFPESGSERGAVGRPGGRLWNASLHEKRPLHELHVPQTPDWTVGPDNLLKPQFSPDSSQLIVADEHGVILWDLSTGEHRLLQGPQAKGLHVNEEGTILGAADPDGDGATTQIWNYTNNHLLALLQPTPEIKVSDCAFSPDGSLVATSYSTGRLDRTKEREIWLWDVESGEKKDVFRGIDGSVSGITFWQSPDGRETRLMASTAASAMALQWDVATFPAKELTPYRCIKNWMLCATYRSDGQAVATSDGYGIRVYPDTGPPFSLYGHRSSTRTVRFHPSGQHLVSAGDDGTVRFWHANAVPFSRGEPLLLRGSRMWGGGVSFSPDGTKLASCEADDSAIRIWDTMTGREERFLTNDGVVWTLQYHPTNGNRLVSAGDGSAKVRIWELDAGTSTPLLGPTHLMRVAVFSPDGARIAAAGEGEDLFVWSALTGQLEKRIKIHDDAQSSNWGVSFSPDGKTIATCSIDASGLVKIWDVESGRLTQVLDSGSPQPLYWVSFSPNGRQVAVASASNDVLIWDLPHPQPRRLKGHREPAISLVYAPDGKRLFSGSYDDHVRVWDVATGRELYSLSANCADVFVLALDPKGKTLAVSGAYGLKVYEAERPPAEVLRERATVREALRILEQPSLKDLPLAEEIVEALDRDDNLDDASRKVAIQIALSRGNNAQALEERKQLDE